MTRNRQASALSIWLPALLLNGIPAVGVLAFGWSVSLILLLYWLENLVGSILWNRLIRRHEQLTRLRGHWRNQLGVREGLNYPASRPCQPANVTMRLS